MKMQTKKRLLGAVSAVVLGLSLSVSSQAAVVLFQEDFEDIDFGTTHEYKRISGVPTSNGASDGNNETIGNADNDWFAARFEYPDGGYIWQDVGAQNYGGSDNPSTVAFVEDDAGILIRIDTTGYENLTLSFDWRTYSTTTSDKLVAGYFIGDLNQVLSNGGLPTFDSPGDTVDLRNAYHGGTDGAWNWNPVNGGNQGDWIELMRKGSSNTFQSETYDLLGAENDEVWIAFWMDNGEGDFGKIDNIVVMGDPVVIPVPAAVWLFGSGLLGIVAVARRRQRFQA